MRNPCGILKFRLANGPGPWNIFGPHIVTTLGLLFCSYLAFSEGAYQEDPLNKKKVNKRKK